jgi:hypothetical protein
MKIYDHVQVMNSEQGVQAIEIAKLATEMAFISKIFWIVATASIGSIIASIWTIIKKDKCN